MAQRPPRIRAVSQAPSRAPGLQPEAKRVEREPPLPAAPEAARPAQQQLPLPLVEKRVPPPAAGEVPPVVGAVRLAAMAVATEVVLPEEAMAAVLPVVVMAAVLPAAVMAAVATEAVTADDNRGGDFMKKLISFLLLVCLMLTMFMGAVSWLTGTDALIVWFTGVVSSLGSMLMPFLIIFAGFYILIRSLFN